MSFTCFLVTGTKSSISFLATGTLIVTGTCIFTGTLIHPPGLGASHQLLVADADKLPSATPINGKKLLEILFEKLIFVSDLFLN
jgi:hypothetical protein